MSQAYVIIAKQSIYTDPWTIHFGGFGLRHYESHPDFKDMQHAAHERFLAEFPQFIVDPVTSEMVYEVKKSELSNDASVPPIALVQSILNHLLRWNACSKIDTQMSISHQYGSQMFMWTVCG